MSNASSEKKPSRTDAVLNVTARAPFHVYYEGEAEVISAVNSVGPFDILPGHADFFSVLTPCDVVIYKASGDPVTFPIRSGIMTVRDNSVLLFANI